MRAGQPSDGKLLVLGAGGQLGRAVVRAVASAWETVGLDHAALDIGNAASLREAIAGLRPAVVVNCAALTDTALCEREEARADALNADAPGVMAEACRAAGSFFVHVSTNEVFDGQSDRPYREADATGPLNAYARSKLAGERLVLAANPAALVLRTAWLYGDGARNFVHRVLGWAANSPTIRVVTDEVATPTACSSLAQAIASLIPEQPAGILHVTDAGSASRFTWARTILRLSRADPERVLPARQVDFPGSAAKAAYSVLDIGRLRACGVRMSDWEEHFTDYMSTRERQARA